MSKEKRPTWFKMFLNQKALIDSVPDEIVGRALKAAFAYFAGEDMPQLDPLAYAVFATIKPYIDESFEDYRKSVENGKAGSAARWNK